MFDKTITNSDDFIDMPDSAQNLYFHLSMNADDDGFVNNWKNIMRMTGHKEDDMKILIAKQYVIPFDSGVIVIRHWRINNYLRADRYTETKFKAEMQQLQLDENLVYQVSTSGIPDGIHRLDKIRLDKNRLDKISIDKSNGTKKFVPPTLEEVTQYVNDKKLSVDPKQFYDYFTEGNWVDAKGNKVKNWKQKLLTWNKYQPKNVSTPKGKSTKFMDVLEELVNDEERDTRDACIDTDGISEILSVTVE